MSKSFLFNRTNFDSKELYEGTSKEKKRASLAKGKRKKNKNL